MEGEAALLAAREPLDPDRLANLEWTWRTHFSSLLRIMPAMTMKITTKTMAQAIAFIVLDDHWNPESLSSAARTDAAGALSLGLLRPCCSPSVGVNDVLLSAVNLMPEAGGVHCLLHVSALVVELVRLALFSGVLRTVRATVHSYEAHDVNRDSIGSQGSVHAPPAGADLEIFYGHHGFLRRVGHP